MRNGRPVFEVEGDTPTTGMARVGVTAGKLAASSDVEIGVPVPDVGSVGSNAGRATVARFREI